MTVQVKLMQKYVVVVFFLENALLFVWEIFGFVCLLRFLANIFDMQSKCISNKPAIYSVDRAWSLNQCFLYLSTVII